MTNIKQGLSENAFQFWMLVLVNAFVGGMVGMERSIFPELAEKVFHVSSHTAILSFITAFGISKAISNYLTGRYSNTLGRRNLLIAGWLIAIPIPLILMYGESWNLVIFANVLLGVNQGICWSSTVIMKIDLVGEKQRGLAMGLNEFSGYLAVGLATYFSAYIASQYGLRPYPFFISLFIVILALAITILFIKDTRSFVDHEHNKGSFQSLEKLFLKTSFTHPNLSATTQAGLVNNLNDGMIWGLLPVLLSNHGFSSIWIGIIAAVYPSVWGISQLGTGKMADIFSNKKILFFGMILQASAIVLLIFVSHAISYILICSILGIGTALVYPTFLVVISRNSNPIQRAETLGIFRFWRDSGYAFGAIISGVLADTIGVNYAIFAIGLITAGSALIIQWRMQDV